MAAHRKYRWEEWFNQPIITLIRGVHYHCSQSSMAQTVRSNASRRGLSIRIIDTGTELIVKVVGETYEVQHTDPVAVVS